LTSTSSLFAPVEIMASPPATANVSRVEDGIDSNGCRACMNHNQIVSNGSKAHSPRNALAAGYSSVILSFTRI
jgi:hypothetical protein